MRALAGKEEQCGDACKHQQQINRDRGECVVKTVTLERLALIADSGSLPQRDAQKERQVIRGVAGWRFGSNRDEKIAAVIFEGKDVLDRPPNVELGSNVCARDFEAIYVKLKQAVAALEQ